MTRPLAIQANVIGALVLRETKTRFGRHRLGYLWAVLGPLAQVAVLMLVFQLVERLAPGGIDFPIFLMTGIVPFYLFQHTLTQCMKAIESNRGLLVYARVKPLDLVIARSVLEAATYVVVFAILLAGASSFGYDGWPDQPLGVLGALAAAALLATGLGALAAAAQAVTPAVERIVPLVMRPLYFASGIFFSVAVVPEPYRSWLLVNPLLHINELMRASFFATYDGRFVDPGYVLAWVLGALFFGLLTQRAFRRWVTVTA